MAAGAGMTWMGDGDGRYGWVCPTCRTVYAPFVMKCSRCPGGVTSDTTTGAGIQVAGNTGTEPNDNPAT